ncbi:uncharacterized protein LY79DRAFT_246292 [Colletotrichum navitas]|uniref:Uncharacterized protein n=1 Tax=Colletotrichum navitas TaxID=681940 RepID=A0AAD8Q9J6_9PEZI|nr:uncharacterized protein LY79DRAFT_246292 [Colletotrichum navitas]KAK1598508.1 hypothetical protein LY79DRAFT_246292 [Colletotrichum navitas]
MKRLVNYQVIGVRGAVRVVHDGPGSISASREEREGPCFADLDGRGRGMAVMEGVRAVLYIRPRARFKLLLLLPVRTVPYLYPSAVRERGRILPKGNHCFPLMFLILHLFSSSSILIHLYIPAFSLLSFPNSLSSCWFPPSTPNIFPDPARVTCHQ